MSRFVPFIEAFTKVVARSPQATSLVTARHRVSYAELDAAANDVASRLHNAGISPGDRVAVQMKRGVNLLAALVGILRSGAVYVPVSTSLPLQRRKQIVGDADVACVLTSGSVLTGLPVPHLAVDHRAEGLLNGADNVGLGRPSRVEVQPQSLAYIIYTSGSTGRPKGVCVSHGALASFLDAIQREVCLGPEDVVLCHTSISFDISLFELLLPLYVGAGMAACSEATALDGRRLGQFISRTAVTVVQATPASWQMLLDAGFSAPRLLKAICGGDTLVPGLGRRLFAACGPFWNAYGPTEATVWSTLYRVVSQPTAAIPIGRPLSNTSVFLLDKELEPVPTGVQGELYLGGGGLAEGYWELPTLTAERFILWKHGRGERMYRTGDLAVELADGNIHYVGRADRQIKLRGFRIELEEIEATLSDHPDVAAGVVVAAQLSPGSTTLVAFVVPKNSQRQPRNLRSFLKKRLPSYMVPSRFILTDKLPITSSHKVNRLQLAAQWKRGTTSPAKQGLARVLADLWTDLLGVEEISDDSDFLALGGDSLLGAQLLARVETALNRPVSLRALFDARTFGAFVKQVERTRQTRFQTVKVAERRFAGALTHNEEGLWRACLKDDAYRAANVGIGFALNGLLDLAVLRTSVDHLVLRHDILRTTYRSVGSGPARNVAPEGAIRVDLLHFDSVIDERVLQQLFTTQCAVAFDLERGPLLRLTVVESQSQHIAMFLVAHHIITDGWSMARIAEELGVLYTDSRLGRSSTLPTVRLTYAAYARAGRQELQGTRLDTLVSFWQNVFSNPPTPVRLRHDLLPPPTFKADSIGAAKTKRFRLTPSQAASLTRLGRMEQATLFMVLLTAYSVLLRTRSREDDIVIGTISSNRTRTKAERLVGFVANTIGIRLSVSPADSFAAALQRVRTTVLDALAHQELPFRLMWSSMGETSAQVRESVLKVTFNMVPKVSLSLGEVRVKPLRFDEAITKADLHLGVSEIEGGLELTLVAKAALFSDEWLGSFAEDFSVLTSRVTTEPSGRLQERLDLLMAST